MLTPALEMIVSYVEGRVSAAALQDALYKTNSDLGRDLETLLSEDVRIRPYTDSGSVYLYLIAGDLRKLSGQLNARDVLSKFLDIKGVQYVQDERSENLFDVILSAQPRWVDVTADVHFNERLQGILGDLHGADLRARIKREIHARFRCLHKPPRWLQSPNWMFKEGRPLIFVGQLDVAELRHDDAQLYVFYDEQDGSYKTVEQSA